MSAFSELQVVVDAIWTEVRSYAGTFETFAVLKDKYNGNYTLLEQAEQGLYELTAFLEHNIKNRQELEKDTTASIFHLNTIIKSLRRQLKEKETEDIEFTYAATSQQIKLDFETAEEAQREIDRLRTENRHLKLEHENAFNETLYHKNPNSFTEKLSENLPVHEQQVSHMEVSVDNIENIVTNSPSANSSRVDTDQEVGPEVIDLSEIDPNINLEIDPDNLSELERNILEGDQTQSDTVEKGESGENENKVNELNTNDKMGFNDVVKVVTNLVPQFSGTPGPHLESQVRQFLEGCEMAKL